jgi:hypothetical protein
MNTRFPSSPQSNPNTELLQAVQQILSKKSSYEIRLEGVIRRLLDTDVEEEKLVIDEIKAAVRAIFSHLKFTDGELNYYISQAKTPAENRKVGRGWIAVNMSKQDVQEMKILARASGIVFRTFLESSLRAAARELHEQLGISHSDVRQLTRRQIAALHERSWLIRHIRSGGNAKQN